jgi:two-component system cell cycle sensor histidine kinase/response regulator CckA
MTERTLNPVEVQKVAEQTKQESPTVLLRDRLLPLESILRTEELSRRPLRPPDYETESRALAALVQALVNSPRTILQTLAETVVELLKADSAGLSLLAKDQKNFYWAAIAGAWQPHIGGGTPRDFGPCGDVLDRNVPLLFTHWERRYPYLLQATPLAEEGLLVPFYVKGKAVGTIWAIAHNDRRKFDAEDVRQLKSLGRFASAAYEMVTFLEALAQQDQALQQSRTELAEVQDSRRAALNVMEDALQARQLVENLNLQLRSEITERERIETELQRLNADLENRVIERTAELLSSITQREKLHEQLLQAQKMESLGTLAAGIAHDFNNILNIIQGYAFILQGQGGAQNREISESLAVIDETIQRGAALVQQLLTMARKTEVKRGAVDANRLIDGLIAVIKETFPKNIELSSDLACDLPTTIGDVNQIGQALLNLCVNARDAMPNGGRMIFRTQSVDAATLQGLSETIDGRYICIEVSDTGVGMDESIRKRIFEPFFTTKVAGHGTGLGLSVVYGIVKSHDGLIDVKSKPERGTAFRLYFPVAPATAQRVTSSVARKSVSDTKAASNGPATIFLVEDEKNMLYLLEKVFLRQGYQVFTATDGEKALEIFLGHKDLIDVVLLDIGLPKIAGRDVLSEMRQANPNVKICVVSGYLEPELQSEIDRMGVRNFLHKPYTPNEVVTTIQSLIQGKS